jgi:hypothetical protein
VIIGKVIVLELQKIYSRKIVQNGTSKTVAVPPKWGDVGERVSVAVRDESTLVVTKEL